MNSVSELYLPNLNDYTIIRETPLGQGGFAIVYLVENQKTKKRYAAKILLNGTASAADQTKLITREISILTRVQAPTIIRFQRFSLTDLQGYPNIAILMDYKENGSLKTLIDKEQLNQAPHEYDNTAKQIILTGIAHGMMILHSRRVLHRDLKPDNVLLDSELNPFLTDFGLSKFTDPDKSTSQSMGACGTVAYMAPEIIDGAHYGFKSDVYSFGILLYEVISGKEAYDGQIRKENFNFHQFGNAVIEGKRPKLDDSIPENLKELIERCWSLEPSQRPTFQELFIKLSLSPDDDEGFERAVRKILVTGEQEEQENNEEQKYNLRYALDGVDVDAVLDYVEQITTFDANEKSQKRIRELEQQLQKYQNVEDLLKQNDQYRLDSENIKTRNNQHKREIELLQKSLNDLNAEYEKLTASKNMPEKPKLKPSNPLEGLNLFEMKRFIQKENLKQIVIPSSVEIIGINGFSDCVSLSEIVIPSSVTSIEQGAFSNCCSVTRIEMPSSVTSIGNNAFAYCCSLTKITIPSSVKSIQGNPFVGCINLEQINVNSRNTEYVSDNSILFTNDKRCLIACPPKLNQNEYVIPSSVTSIGECAFSDCNRLTTIKIPSSVISIGNFAFSNFCSLTSINIPSSVTSIGIGAFNNCCSITSIEIPSSVTIIENCTFSDCRKLIHVTIPSSIISIGESAFSNCCSLPEIEIPSSVEIIDNYALYGCSSITKLFIPSSVLIFGSDVFSECTSLERLEEERDDGFIKVTLFSVNRN